jgi:hypothetical protein
MSVAMEVFGGEELHFGDSRHRASVLPQVHSSNWEALQRYDYVMFSQPMIMIQNQTMYVCWPVASAKKCIIFLGMLKFSLFAFLTEYFLRVKNLELFWEFNLFF